MKSLTMNFPQIESYFSTETIFLSCFAVKMLALSHFKNIAKNEMAARLMG